MELAKHLCENLRKQYPADSFVAFALSMSGTGNIVCDMNGSRVIRLALSNAQAINDSGLKSLLHRLVFESKSMGESPERTTFLCNQIEQLLPNYYNSVFVSPLYSNDIPLVFGPHKGLAYFWEPEFGAHVTVLLH